MDGYFADGTECELIKNAEESCTGIGQCVENSECSSSRGGRCDCNPGFYPESGRCLAIKSEGLSVFNSDVVEKKK